MNPSFFEMRDDVTADHIPTPIRPAALGDYYGITRQEAGRLLCRWHRRGWLLRVGVGRYDIAPAVRVTRPRWSGWELGELARRRAAGENCTQIARALGRSPTGVSLAYRRHVRGPRLVTSADNADHVRIGATLYCGDRWCPGTCGLPAGYLDRPALFGSDTQRFWARGPMAARGPVMEILQVDHHATGRTVDLSTVLTDEEQAQLFRLWWS